MLAAHSVHSALSTRWQSRTRKACASARINMQTPRRHAPPLLPDCWRRPSLPSTRWGRPSRRTPSVTACRAPVPHVALHGMKRTNWGITDAWSWGKAHEGSHHLHPPAEWPRPCQAACVERLCSRLSRRWLRAAHVLPDSMQRGGRRAAQRRLKLPVTLCGGRPDPTAPRLRGEHAGHS